MLFSTFLRFLVLSSFMFHLSRCHYKSFSFSIDNSHFIHLEDYLYNPWFIPFFNEKLALPLSCITNGISTLFQSSCKTARLVEAATMTRGSKASREMFDALACCCASSSVVDEEMKEVYEKYKKERDEMHF